jgi:hypothetical protein
MVAGSIGVAIGTTMKGVVSTFDLMSTELRARIGTELAHLPLALATVAQCPTALTARPHLRPTVDLLHRPSSSRWAVRDRRLERDTLEHPSSSRCIRDRWEGLPPLSKDDLHLAHSRLQRRVVQAPCMADRCISRSLRPHKAEVRRTRRQRPLRHHRVANRVHNQQSRVQRQRITLQKSRD